MGRRDFAYVIGLAIANEKLRTRILDDPKKFAEELHIDLSESEVEFLKRKDVRKLVDEFIKNLKVEYEEDDGRKGR
jgi:hypothetical protein